MPLVWMPSDGHRINELKNLKSEKNKGKKTKLPLILIFSLHKETVPFSRAGCIDRGVGGIRRRRRWQRTVRGAATAPSGGAHRARGYGGARHVWRAVWGRARAAGLGTRRAVRGLRPCGARKQPRLGRSGADVRWPAYGGRRRLSSGRPSKSRRPAGRSVNLH